MGLIPTWVSPGAPNPSQAGQYANPGAPGQAVTGLGRAGDNLRGTIVETPILVVALGYLYHKTFISGDPRRSWGITDVILIVVTAHLLKRVGVAQRWKEVA